MEKSSLNNSGYELKILTGKEISKQRKKITRREM